MSNKIYAGFSAFPATRKGNHNWLDNHKRPFASCQDTKKSGKKRFLDLFLQDHVTTHVTEKAKKIDVPADSIVLVIPIAENKPFLKCTYKD